VDVFSAALLGAIQGLTEFLPVSSSAHLILGRAFFGWESERLGLAFDVACHLGTLAAVLAYFRDDLVAMAAVMTRALSSDLDSARLARLIAVGTVPTVLVGLTLTDLITTHLRTPLVAAAALAVGGVGLLVAERFGPRVRDERTLTTWEALAIGAAQAAALVPGISRSGATLTVALLLGLRREAGARFSFLLGIPAVMAAGGKEGLELRHLPFGPDVQAIFVVGILVSGLVGYLTIKYFLKFLARHSLAVFAYYRLALAAAVPLWLAVS
jgi:undecaprenyl-diphosphatase